MSPVLIAYPYMIYLVPWTKFKLIDSTGFNNTALIDCTGGEIEGEKEEEVNSPLY